MKADTAVILTGFSQTTMGVFKEGKPPVEMEDVLLYIQAIAWDKEDGYSIQGEVLLVEASEVFGESPFDIDIYLEKRNPPYHTIGYEKKRTLKNVRLEAPIGVGSQPQEWMKFTAEVDTGWEDIEFMYEEVM